MTRGLAPQETEKAARFASAEAMRWLGWGARSYYDYALGLALLLIAAAIMGRRGSHGPESASSYSSDSWVVALTTRWELLLHQLPYS